MWRSARNEFVTGLNISLTSSACRVSRGTSYRHSRTRIPRCTKVTHFSPKLSLSTSYNSSFALHLPLFFCCLLSCRFLCVPVRTSVQTFFFSHQPSSRPLRQRCVLICEVCFGDTSAWHHTHTLGIFSSC